MWHRAVCLLTVHSICVLNYKFGYIVFIVVENATYLILVSLVSKVSGKGLHHHTPTFVLHLPFHLPGFDPRWTLPHKIALSHGEIWTPPSNTRYFGSTQVCPQHLDHFSHYCTAHPCAQHTDNGETTLCVKCVGQGLICALCAGNVAHKMKRCV